MTGMSVAYLLAPSIIFVTMALVALYYAACYTDIAEGRTEVANVQKWERQIDEMDAKIAAGEQEPSRFYMMGCLRKSEAIGSSWRTGVSACAMTMRRVGYLALFGVVAQFYVIFRLRAHYKKLANGAALPS